MTKDAPYQPLRTGNKTVIMSMRIPEGLRDQMIEDMEMSGDYSNMSQWVQQAIRDFLVKRRMQRQNKDGNREGSSCAGGRFDRSRAEPPGG